MTDNILYEGKAKKMKETNDPDTLLMEFKDDATAFDGEKTGMIEGKGSINATLSSVFFELLKQHGVPTHYEKTLDDRQLLVRKLEIIPVEVVVRNIAAGSLSDRLGLEEGTELDEPILEWYYKSDELGDPMLNKNHIFSQNLATAEELEKMREQAFRINDILVDYLAERGIDLVDFKMEFGRRDGDLLLADEISADTSRFWDSETGEKLDKDRFRRDLGKVEDAYDEILERVTK